MKGFIEGLDRSQTTLLPDSIDDCADEANPVRAVDAFVDMLDLAALGFEPEATGRPGCHPATTLRLYVYGYLNQVQSSRRLERECARYLELIWLMGRLKQRWPLATEDPMGSILREGPVADEPRHA